jgi:hypothetical protein
VCRLDLVPPVGEPEGLLIEISRQYQPTMAAERCSTKEVVSVVDSRDARLRFPHIAAIPILARIPWVREPSAL